MTRHSSEHGEHTAPADAGPANAAEEDLPLIVGHAEMDAAFDRGVAVPVSQSIGWLMRYRTAWWVVFEQGWLRVIEGPIADNIDELYPRLAAAEAEAEAARSEPSDGG